MTAESRDLADQADFDKEGDSAPSHGTPKGSREPAREERRKGPADRRQADEDRRNSDRVAQDFEPRRDPERSDRRKGSR